MMKKINKGIKKLFMAVTAVLLASALSVTSALAGDGPENDVIVGVQGVQAVSVDAEGVSAEASGDDNEVAIEEGVVSNPGSELVEAAIEEEVGHTTALSQELEAPKPEIEGHAEEVDSLDQKPQAPEPLGMQTRGGNIDDLDWLWDGPNAPDGERWESVGTPWDWARNNGVISELPEGIAKAEFIEDLYVKGEKNYRFESTYGQYIPLYVKVTKEDGSEWITNRKVWEYEYYPLFVNKLLLDEYGNKTSIPVSGAAFEVIHEESGDRQVLTLGSIDLREFFEATDESGELIMPLGTYTIKEIQAPDGYELNPDCEIRIKNVIDEVEPMYPGDPVEYAHRITGVDGSELSHIAFYNKENFQSKLSILKKQGDQEGELTFEEPQLDFGEYTHALEKLRQLVELFDAQGLEIDDFGIRINYTDHNGITKEVVVFISEEGDIATDSKYSAADYLFQTVKTAKDMLANANDSDYIDNVMASFRMGNILRFWEAAVEIPANTSKVEVLEAHGLTVPDFVFTPPSENETNAEGELKGAEFELIAGEDVSYINEFGEYILVHKKGELVAKLVTDETGTITQDGLYKGTYILKEVKAPEGFALGGREYSITIDRKGHYTFTAYNIEGVPEKPIVPEKPADPINPEEPKKIDKPKAQPIPKTSDTSNALGLLALGLISGAGVLVSGVYSRRAKR